MKIMEGDDDRGGGWRDVEDGGEEMKENEQYIMMKNLEQKEKKIQ
jgi:hypothetical protein